MIYALYRYDVEISTISMRFHIRRKISLFTRLKTPIQHYLSSSSPSPPRLLNIINAYPLLVLSMHCPLARSEGYGGDDRWSATRIPSRSLQEGSGYGAKGTQDGHADQHTVDEPGGERAQSAAAPSSSPRTPCTASACAAGRCGQPRHLYDLRARRRQAPSPGSWAADDLDRYDRVVARAGPHALARTFGPARSLVVSGRRGAPAFRSAEGAPIDTARARQRSRRSLDARRRQHRWPPSSTQRPASAPALARRRLHFRRARRPSWWPTTPTTFHGVASTVDCTQDNPVVVREGHRDHRGHPRAFVDAPGRAIRRAAKRERRRGERSYGSTVGRQGRRRGRRSSAGEVDATTKPASGAGVQQRLSSQLHVRVRRMSAQCAATSWSSSDVGLTPKRATRAAARRGSLYIERIYSPTRIKHPPAPRGRTGLRTWQRMSWDRAVSNHEYILDRHRRVRPQAIVFDTCSGKPDYVNITARSRAGVRHGAFKPAVCYDYAAGHGIHRVLGAGDWRLLQRAEQRARRVARGDPEGNNPCSARPWQWRCYYSRRGRARRHADNLPRPHQVGHGAPLRRYVPRHARQRRLPGSLASGAAYVVIGGEKAWWTRSFCARRYGRLPRSPRDTRGLRAPGRLRVRHKTAGRPASRRLLRVGQASGRPLALI